MFRTVTGRVLDYGKLWVLDSEGREVPARLVVQGTDTVSIVIADVGYRYPLLVDPLLTASADWQVESNQAHAHMGYSVASAGDVNGDGYADVIVGAPLYNNVEAVEGAAFVYHGSATGLSITAAWQVESNQAGATLGISVASAGDVNGDGYADVIVGAHSYDNVETDEGAAFVYHGSATGLSITAAWQVESNLAGARMGVSVASAGDVNGDGYADVVVGAFGYDNLETNEGAAFVYHGSAVGLSTTPATVLESNQAGAWLGWSVASAGDVNGDGYADVVVGAPYNDNVEADEGAAFVYHGSAPGLSTTPATVLESNQAGAHLGWSVASAGDVNGDGYTDVVVGAYQYDNGQIDEGAAFVYHGSATGLTSTAATMLESNQANASLGVSVASAGDVNGDGYADVMVGVPYYDNGQTDEGAAFVYHGSATGLSTTPATVLELNQANALLGYSFASAGDVNGDGYTDVVVGAYRYENVETNEGAAFVYHGSATGLSITAATQLESNQGLAHMGHSVASAGDVNGDGYGDVVVGVPYYDNGQTNEGAVFVYHGSANGLATTAAWQAESNQANAKLGNSVASAGDVNGDGYGDVIVGVHYYDNSHEDEGAAFVYHGSATGLATTPDKKLDSNQYSAYMGSSVASAGDVNGDGYGDVIVGAEYYDNGQTNEGAAFVYHGSATGLSRTAAVQLESNQAGARMGVSVASAGDVNGDGYADVVVGALGYDNDQTDEGGALIYHGSANGLTTTPATQLESNQTNAWLGSSVASAGDVNGDGYADVVVGAYLYDNGQTNEGAAFVYHGSATGLSTTPATVLELNQANALLGYSVASAGDVNGDGYADVVVGAHGYDNGETSEGAAFVYHGSATGLSTTPATQLESNRANAFLGHSVASAGDVNGDGYADVIVGAPVYDNVQTDEGAAFVYYGNGGAGRTLLAAQYDGASPSSALPRLGMSALADGFEVRMAAYAPQGRSRVKLQVEACEAGVAFGNVACTIHTSASWADVGTSGTVNLSETLFGLNNNTLYRWRARVLYAPLTVTVVGITAPVNPAHGPWRYFEGQVGTGSVYTTNNFPQIDGTVANLAVDDNATLNPFSAVTLSDADGDDVTVTVLLDDATKGVFSALSGFSDAGGGLYTLASSTPSAATTALRGLLYEPADNRVVIGATENTAFTITVNDGTVDTTDSTTTVMSISVNDIPTITGIPATSVAEDAAYSFTPVGNDVDVGDSLSYSISNKPSWASFNIGTGELSGIPTNDHVGITSGIVISVTDSSNASDSLAAFNLTVNNTNDAPSISGTPATSVAEDAAYSFTPVGADVDVSDSLSYSITNMPSWASFNTGTGELSGTPTNDHVGTTSGIVITVRDSNNASALLAAFDLTVNNTNDAPIISGTSATSVDEDSAYSFTPVGADVDAGDSLSYSITNQPGWASFSTTTGALTGTPTNTDVGTTSSIVITVKDSSNATDSLAAFNLTVNNTNDAPTISGTPATSVDEDSAYSFTPVGVDVDAGDSLSYSISNKPTWATFNTSTGVLSGRPANEHVGTTSGIVITVADSSNASDALAAFDLTVNNTNDIPTITSIEVTAVDEDSAYSYTFAASDEDEGAPLTLSAPVLPAWLSFNAQTGELTGTPTNNDVGNHNVTLRVNDGTVDVEQSFVISVANTNDAPTITSTAVTAVDEDAAYSYAFAASDVDAGDTLTFSAPVKPIWLTFTPGTGVLSGTPTNAEVGNHNVTLRVNDGTVDVEQSFVISVANINDAPTITSTAVTAVDEDAAYSYTFVASDVDAGDTLTFSAPVKPTWLTFTPATGVLSGTPTNTEVGVHNVTLRVNDGTVDVDQSLTITVANVNDAPIISGTPATTVNEDAAYSFTPSVEDVDAGDTHQFDIVNQPSWASFNTSDGHLSGTPTNADVGITEEIEIGVSDNNGGRAQLPTFNLTVVNTNDAPLMSGNPLRSIVEGQPYRFIVSATDEDGDTLSYSLNANAPGFMSVSGEGVISGTPERVDVGSHADIVVSVSDGHGGSASLAAFTLEVIGDLDRDGTTDGLDDDIDGDGMLNVFEDEHGLDSYDAADAALDSDGDGLSNLKEFEVGLNPTEDDVPPMVTAPDEITIGATGLKTLVELGSATATDTLDGELVATSDAPTVFSPGAHTVTWSATDAAGNTGEDTQQVNIQPRVSFGPNQKTAEGAVATVPFYLNGTAPGYPVSIGYRVSGTANVEEDHDLFDGRIELLAGTEAVLSFNTVGDGKGEGDETIILTLAELEGVVAGSRTEHTITLKEGNVAPEVELSATQAGLPVTTVLMENGEVYLEAIALDANGDELSYKWLETNGLTNSETGLDNVFAFDPAPLEEGSYLFEVQVSDGKRKTTAELNLLLIHTVVALASDQDRDDDGLNDALEGYIDTDGDGLLEYLDDTQHSNVMVLRVGNEVYLQSESGLQITLGSLAQSNGQGAQLSVDEINLLGVPEDKVAATDGYVDITIKGLGEEGDSVQVVVPLSTALEAGNQLRLYNGKSWQAFKEDDNNLIYSTPSVGGVCPEAGDAVYQSGLQEGADCVMLVIEDGGANDADRSDDRQISLVVGVSPEIISKAKGGGGGALLWLLGLLLLSLLGMYRRAARSRY